VELRKLVSWAIYWILRILLFLFLLAGAVSSAVFAVITAVPDASASKTCRLGYRAHCAFTPYSTIILIGIALVLGFLFVRLYGKKIRQILGAVRGEKSG